MTVKEFLRSCMQDVMPRYKRDREQMQMKITDRHNHPLLVDNLTHEKFAKPGTLNRQVIAWWIDVRTVRIVVD